MSKIEGYKLQSVSQSRLNTGKDVCIWHRIVSLEGKCVNFQTYVSTIATYWVSIWAGSCHSSMSLVCMKVGANSCVYFKQPIRRCNPLSFWLIIAFNSLICKCFLCVSFLKIWEITIEERCNPHKMLLIYRENPYLTLHIALPVYPSGRRG